MRACSLTPGSRSSSGTTVEVTILRSVTKFDRHLLRLAQSGLEDLGMKYEKPSGPPCRKRIILLV